MARGLRRILACLESVPNQDCELIVFDDSPGDELKRVVTQWRQITGLRLAYQHNRPARGAVANWNALLDAAAGKYCLLMHHDEFPLGDNFIYDLIAALRRHPNVDVLILDCILVASKSGRNRRHLPTWLRALVINRFPDYLFRRNVIGPTSTLVIRRSIYPRFDEKLRWLVDVDAYGRLLKVARHLRVTPHIKIASVLGRSDSITARLGSSIPKIEKAERAYLRGRQPTASFWVAPSPNDTAGIAFVRACEAIGWVLMRGMTRTLALVCPYTVRRSIVQKALHVQSKR